MYLKKGGHAVPQTDYLDLSPHPFFLLEETEVSRNRLLWFLAVMLLQLNVKIGYELAVRHFRLDSLCVGPI